MKLNLFTKQNRTKAKQTTTTTNTTLLKKEKGRNTSKYEILTLA